MEEKNETLPNSEEDEDLDTFLCQYYEILQKSKKIDKIKKSLRLKIIETMKELNLKNAFTIMEDGRNIHANLKLPKSFDLGTCHMENVEIMKDFLRIEVETVEKEIFDKRTFILSHPKLYEKYLVDLTPRLTLK